MSHDAACLTLQTGCVERGTAAAGSVIVPWLLDRTEPNWWNCDKIGEACLANRPSLHALLIVTVSLHCVIIHTVLIVSDTCIAYCQAYIHFLSVIHTLLIVMIHTLLIVSDTCIAYCQ